MKHTSIWTMLLVASVVSMTSMASSHREAPQITETPKVDATDFYMFTSYENGRSDFVTLIANYLPLQDAYGGPNYFMLDDDAIYEINVDNDGDAVRDLSFRFDFTNELKGQTLDIGDQQVAIPIIQSGQILPGDSAALNVMETYQVTVIHYDESGEVISSELLNHEGITEFTKPVDFIGTKTLPEYEAYASQYIYDVTIPGCVEEGRLFVGQRKESFVVNLGEIFDLINLNPLGEPNSEENSLEDKNITTLSIEVPKACLLDQDPVVGAWTTASLPKANIKSPKNSKKFPEVNEGNFVQVSRLGMPLVNEVVIGLPDKDTFNNSMPSEDGQFLRYVTNPTLPALIEILFGVPAPAVPRDDLVSVFLTGLPGLNQPMNVVPSEMLRLNTALESGFPNGRLPEDDVVDIALNVVMQAEGLNDGAYIDGTFFDETFPYLKTPIPGSPNEYMAP